MNIVWLWALRELIIDKENKMWRIWELKWRIWKTCRRAICWFVGHNKVSGNPHEDDYCDKCFIDWPQDRIALPTLLNQAYCWFVDHGWPEALDLWLLKHFNMPSWWEY